MKILALLMTLIMLFASLDLCKDDEVSDSNVKIEYSKTKKDSHASNDSCSPFCNCARCSFSILIPGPVHLLPSLGSIRPVYKHVTEGYPIQISNAVWQPPKSA